jgi:hypothetical protein
MSGAVDDGGDSSGLCGLLPLQGAMMLRRAALECRELPGFVEDTADRDMAITHRQAAILDDAIAKVKLKFPEYFK